jgi:hypothetical protein
VGCRDKAQNATEVIPASGTFDYVAIVPERAVEGAFECEARLREPIVCTGKELRDSRLVGHAPVLRVADGGITPDPGPDRPRVMRSRVTLTASSRQHSQIAAASFHVDEALFLNARPRDVVHMTRTSCGGVGLSIIRDGELVVAVGAVTSVPLGRSVSARIPTDLTERAEAIFREHAPEFTFVGLPVEITVNGSSLILYRGRPTLTGYAIFVIHGYLPGMPGKDESLALSRKGTCPDSAANLSAMLLECEGTLSMTRW